MIPGFEILRSIGRGGMGEVYLARQLSLGRPVALKILSLASKADPVEQAARFRREADLMARVRHANVISVYDFGTNEGRPYLVMEYIEGGDLRRRMEAGRPLPVDQVRPLVLPVAEALACLHGHGILHRDLKPENILMDRGSTPKVTDFGLAVLDSDVGALPGTDPAMGTLGYASPEQQFRLGVDERSDQYSMAAMMYELLTGHRPLGIVKPPSRLNHELGPGVDAALLRALQDDPDDRYANVREFGEAFDRALSAPSVGPRRRQFLWAAAGAAVAAAGVATVVSRSKRPHAAARPPPPPPPPPPAHAAVPGARVAAPTAGPAPLINSLGMILVPIPAGAFLMGAAPTDVDADEDEKPRHPVRISRPFHLGATEVTVGQFRAFVAERKYRTEAEKDGRGGIIFNSKTKRPEQSTIYHWRNPGLPLPQTDHDPVVQVTWNDAMAFCRWLSVVERRTYRLPTEAEWEYACRAGSTGRWCMGDDPRKLVRFAWFRDRDGYTTHPVGCKEPNAFGLYDMHGNVWEWCFDVYEPYSAAPSVDPTSAPSGQRRVLRGGACAPGEHGRSSAATRRSRKRSYRFFRYGFRVCCPPTDKTE